MRTADAEQAVFLRREAKVRLAPPRPAASRVTGAPVDDFFLLKSSLF